MNVPSFEFLGFAAVVAILVNISSAPRLRRAILVLANLAFLLSFSRSPAALAPFAGLLAFGFASIKLVERWKRRAVFAILVVVLVAAFCWLKRYSFVPAILFLPNAYLAVGISYVFFRVLHLVIDAYQETLPERISVPAYLSYTLNFTSFVSGPIQFYKDYRRSESGEEQIPSSASLGEAAVRIAFGFFKVSVISPLLFSAHERSLTALLAASAPAPRVEWAAGAVAIFPLYLYVNFSGYMDFVIGVARFMRLHLPENFDRPFMAQGFIDFWARWHMTLSNWLKTYVYSPLLLALMRRWPAADVQPLLGVAVYFITFFLVGVWHGQTATFLVFGVLQGLGVSVNKLYQIAMTNRLGRVRYRALCADPRYAAVSRGVTFSYFALTLLWFWASWPAIAELGRRLGPGEIAAAAAIVLVAATLGLAACKSVNVMLLRVPAVHVLRTSPYALAAWCAVLLGITVSVTAVLNAPAPHVVYKAF